MNRSHLLCARFKTLFISPVGLALLGGVFLLASRGLVSATTFVVEAEKLETPGAWELSMIRKNPAIREYLTAGTHARSSPAAGAIELPHAGKWRLWVRSKDFPKDRPGIRTFTVRLGQKPSDALFGRHGQGDLDGWAWEDGGVFDLPGGATLVSVGDKAEHSARCDALVVTDNLSYTPAGPPWLLQKESAKMVPLTITEESKRHFLPEPIVSAETAAVATLQNAKVQVTFHRAKTANGAAIAMLTATWDGKRWVPVAEDSGAESYRVIYRPMKSDPKIVLWRVHPRWDLELAPKIEATAGGASVNTQLGVATAPWASGRCFPLRPSGARQVDARTVELTFPATEVGQLSATWRIDDAQPMAHAELRFKPAAPGHVSLGYHGPMAAAPADLDFLLLPPVFQGRRFPEQTETLLSAVTPTPMALVNRAGVSCAVVAEPGDLSPEWPGITNSRYAFALRNESGQAQPMLFTPVLGQPGSVSDGAEVRGHFQLWLPRGDWYAGYRKIADEGFGLTDYRRPVKASLSDTVFNLLDLMRDPAAGWQARAKAPWNIESRNTVTQTSPLVYMSLYLLTGDEDFYRKFALPSLEFLLSRPSPHFAVEREIWDNYYHHQPMRGPSGFYGATTFASAFAMTQGRSGVFGNYSLDDKGGPRITRGNGHVQAFEDALALYRLTGEKHWLELAMTGADKYVAANITTLPTRDLGESPFVNISFVPDWEGLLHLYQASGEPRYLAAAQEGARWLLTSFWTQPTIPKGEMTINPGGLYDAQRHVWWFGDRLFRRGLYDGPASWEAPQVPTVKLPEHQVPAWQVSRVGLGLEQPSTYTRNGPHANILMNIWAPALLRLSPLANDPAFRTAARNAMIGRFANYPGYYLDGFTDELFRPDYPMTGPDVTSFYVHHVPPFAASVLDFLFTDAETRSKGAITFPWVRQCGYVWFDSRLFGHAPGKIYGQSAWPWLHRTAATVDTINVDRLLAQGDGKFHVILLNQVHEPQPVRVTFDPKVLGRALDGAKLTVHLGNQAAASIDIENNAAELTLPPLGIATLTLDDVKIDVPTQRVAPPETLKLPTAPASRRSAFPNTEFEAVGTVLEVPPFTWRDLYVSLTPGLDEAKAARLHYRVGDSAEKTAEVLEFPFEFSVRVDDLKQPITWRAEVQLPDGRWVAEQPR